MANTSSWKIVKLVLYSIVEGGQILPPGDQMAVSSEHFGWLGIRLSLKMECCQNDVTATIIN